MRKLNDSGMAMVFSIIIAVFLTVVISAAVLRTQIQLQDSSQRILSQQAFNAAETGIQKAVFELRRNPQWRPGSNGIPNYTDVPLQYNADISSLLGYYTIEVANAAQDYQSFQSVWVKATGKDASTRITRSILARVIVENPTNFFISSAGDLRIGSGSTFDSDFLGRDIYFDINDNLPEGQRNIYINGNIYYLNHVYGMDNPAVVRSPDSESIHFPTLTFTGIDIDRYRSMAINSQGYYIDGPFNYSGDIGLSELNAPNGIVFAEGDIHISGTIKDSMLFVSKGNIYIDNNIEPPAGIPIPAQLGLLARNNVYISLNAPNDININAFVMADGAEAGHGGAYAGGGVFQAQGTKLSKGTLRFNGSMALRGSGVRTAADLNVYQNRIYNYNNQLHDNPTIPLLPSFANIVHWQEINPSDPIPP